MSIQNEVSIKTSFDILKLLLNEKISVSVDNDLYKSLKKLNGNIEIKLYKDLNSRLIFFSA